MKNSNLLLTVITVIFFCGCGKNIVTVTGEVLYEGKPAKEIVILFEPKSDAVLVSESGLAVTDSSGRFTLKSSSDKRGLEPGNYTVYMNWKGPDNVNDEYGDAGPPPGVEVKSNPSPYQFPAERPEIIVSVQGSGKNHFVFKITPKEILWE